MDIERLAALGKMANQTRALGAWCGTDTGQAPCQRQLSAATASLHGNMLALWVLRHQDHSPMCWRVRCGQQVEQIMAAQANTAELALQGCPQALCGAVCRCRRLGGGAHEDITAASSTGGHTSTESVCWSGVQRELTKTGQRQCMNRPSDEWDA
jgi:hypothetical protein